MNEWPSRSCLILCQTCCPHLHTDNQEIIAAKGDVCRQEGRSGRCLGPESSPASKGLEGPGKTLAPRSVSASEPPSLPCPFPLLLFGPESLSPLWLPWRPRGSPATQRFRVTPEASLELDVTLSPDPHSKKGKSEATCCPGGQVPLPTHPPCPRGQHCPLWALLRKGALQSQSEAPRVQQGWDYERNQGKCI